MKNDKTLNLRVIFSTFTGIVLIRTRLGTEALTEFIEQTPLLRGLPQPVKPVRLVGQGQDTETEKYMTEHEQKVALQKFRDGTF